MQYTLNYIDTGQVKMLTFWLGTRFVLRPLDNDKIIISTRELYVLFLIT